MTDGDGGEVLERSDDTQEGECTDDIDAMAASLADEISSESFNDWYTEREWRENIRQGTPYFNGPSQVKPATNHSPSTLLKCHRKIYYNQLNAPEEAEDPHGIFFFGTQFEEEIALPYLREAIAGPDQYVSNSMWVDFTVSTEAGKLRIRGETDPVVVDRQADPILVSEIKTKRSVRDIESPNRHHRAQTHCYMKGLSEKHDRDLTTAVIIYGSRSTLDLNPFRIKFDPWFWRATVLNWASEHTAFRLDEELPPANPEYGWECEFCQYAERCGEGESKHADCGATGLLPGTAYPRPKLKEYLQSYDDTKLTPVLAHHYPGLAEDYDVLDWACRSCGATYSWDDIDWEGSTSDLPGCPSCADTHTHSQLRGPPPSEQLGEREPAADGRSDKTR